LPVVKTSLLADLLAIDPHDHRKKQCGHAEQLQDHPPANLDQLEISIFSPILPNHRHHESPRDDEYDGTPTLR
jgi:hypothetical protein